MNPYSRRLANISNPYPCCPQPGVQGIQGIAGYNGNNGAQGTAGLQGIQGISGIQGAQGTRGENGIGERGFDANSSKWRSQPNAQFVTIGNFQVVPFDASFVTINHIKISQFDYFSTDMNNWFNSLNVNDRISIRNDIQSNIYGIYRVSAPPQIISQLPNNPPPNNLPIVDISLTFISGINSNVGPYIINGVTQGPANFYIGYAITGPQGTSGGGGGGGGSDWDPSFNYYFTKKPEFIIDPSGKYDIQDQRIELLWKLPQQIRAAPNFISAPTNSRQTNVLSPAFRGIPGQAPYYPASHTNQNNILNLIVPSVSTGYYTSPQKDPSFNDLNYLPYHQYLGVDYRTRATNGNISTWQPITPNDLGFGGENGNIFKGEQNLWYQTRGLNILDGLSANNSKGNYSPNQNPGPGNSQGDFIYQLEDNNKFTSIGGNQYQFRVYLTNNSSEILSPTSYDISFNSENPPYWRYRYIPDICNNYITFGSPGFATPPRNISNGNGQPSGGPIFQDPPSQTYRTLTIIGANNNDIPFIDPSGSPASTSSNSTSPADTSLNIPFNQLTIYGCSVNYGFDISRVYIRDILTPWGEQNNPPILTDFSFTLFSKNIFTNNWTTASNSHFSSPNVPVTNNPANINNTIIYPGFSYTLDNYFMGLNVATSQTPDLAYTCMFNNSNGLGRGGDGTNNEISYSRMVIKPPSRSIVSNIYTSYLTNLPLFIESGFQNQNNTDSYIKQNQVYPANSNSLFPNSVYFFTSGANASDYYITLNQTRSCVNNKNNSTLGWIDGITGETIIGDDLSLFGSNGGLSRFILNSVDKNTNVTTQYAGAWSSSAPSPAVNSLLELTVSASKDAEQGFTGIFLERLHGWYMGIDVTQATAKGINLSNYPDIAIRNSQPIGGTNYSPYVFTLNQQIDTNITGSASNTPVGQTSQYSLYIAEIENPILWNPSPFTPVTIPMTTEFFGLNRPTNNNISTTGFIISGLLTQVSTRWRPSNEIMNGEVKYYQSNSSTVTLSNANVNKSFIKNWTVPQINPESINETLQITKGDLQQTSMNYSRDFNYTPQFRVNGTYKNNVTLTPTDQTYIYNFSFSTPNLLWWDYTYNQFSNTILSNTGIDSGGGFYPDNPTGTNGFFNAYQHTIELPNNQLMWAKTAYRAGSTLSVNTNPYINYHNVYHQQPSYSTYSSKQTTGESISITYTPYGVYYRDNPFISGSTTTIIGTYKWLNLKIIKTNTLTNFLTVTVQSGSSTLQLGTDYLLFVCEKAAFSSTESPYTNRSGWKDASRAFDASLSGTARNTNGVGINTFQYSSSSSTAPDNGGPLNIFKNNQANLEMFLRIGLINNSSDTITNVSFNFTI